MFENRFEKQLSRRMLLGILELIRRHDLFTYRLVGGGEGGAKVGVGNARFRFPVGRSWQVFSNNFGGFDDSNNFHVATTFDTGHNVDSESPF